MKVLMETQKMKGTYRVCHLRTQLGQFIMFNNRIPHLHFTACLLGISIAISWVKEPIKMYEKSSKHFYDVIKHSFIQIYILFY